MVRLKLLLAVLCITTSGIFAESQETGKILNAESASCCGTAKAQSKPASVPSKPEWMPSPAKISLATPQLEAQVKGGQLYSIGEQKLVILAGDPYTIGYAHGQLLAGGVQRNVKRVLDCIRYRKKYDKIKEAWKRLKPFMPERYLQEIKGIADGSGVPLEEVQLANVFPALFHCSGFALFGDATKTGELYHGRVLDYMTALDFQKDAVAVITKSKGCNTFINFSYSGLIGCVTGMNDKEIAIGEMGGGGAGKWDGLAMSLLVRLALEKGSTLQETVDIFDKTPRTCEYFYIISDGKITDARALYTTPEFCKVFKPGDLCKVQKLEYQQPKDGVVASGPPRLLFLTMFIKRDYGKITEKMAIELMNRPVAMKSNLHDALFVPAKLKAYLANAADPKEVERFQACYQTYQFYNCKKLMPIADKLYEEATKK